MSNNEPYDPARYQPHLALGVGRWIPDRHGVQHWVPLSDMAVCGCCGRAELLAHGGEMYA